MHERRHRDLVDRDFERIPTRSASSGLRRRHRRRPRRPISAAIDVAHQRPRPSTRSRQTKAAVSAAVGKAARTTSTRSATTTRQTPWPSSASTTVRRQPLVQTWRSQNMEPFARTAGGRVQNPQVPSTSTVEGDVKLLDGPPATKAEVTVCTVDSGVVYEPAGSGRVRHHRQRRDHRSSESHHDGARGRRVEALSGQEHRALDRAVVMPARLTLGRAVALRAGDSRAHQVGRDADEGGHV